MGVDLSVHDNDGTLRAVPGAKTRAEIYVDLVLEPALGEKAFSRLDGLLVSARKAGTPHADDNLRF